MINVLQLRERLEHAGGTVTWYSGYGMMGKEVLGITGDLRACRSCIAEAIKQAHADVRTNAITPDDFAKLNAEFDEIVDHLVNHKTDQLGEGVVLYFPQLTRPEGSEDPVDGSFVP